MSRFAKLLLSLSVCLVLFGCAHPINMNPDLARIEAAGLKVVDMQVGYHISDASKAVEVTTPGGGGDKVRYFPYRDLEPGFYKALGEVFKGDPDYLLVERSVRDDSGCGCETQRKKRIARIDSASDRRTLCVRVHVRETNSSLKLAKTSKNC